MGKRGAGSTPRVDTLGPRNRPWEPPPRQDSVAGTRSAGRPAAPERSPHCGDSAAMESGRPQAAAPLAGSRSVPSSLGPGGGDTVFVVVWIPPPFNCHAFVRPSGPQFEFEIVPALLAWVDLDPC